MVQKRYDVTTETAVKIEEYRIERGFDTQAKALDDIIRRVDIHKLLKVKK